MKKIHLFGGSVEGGDGIFLGESLDDDSPCVAVIPDEFPELGPLIVKRVNQGEAVDSLLDAMPELLEWARRKTPKSKLNTPLENATAAFERLKEGR